MDRRTLQELLAAVQAGSCSVDEALERLRHLPYEDLGFAKLDHHRGLRNGFPEVVLGEGKDAAQVVAIAKRLHDAGGDVLVTRLAAEAAGELLAAVPGFRYDTTARVAWCRTRELPPTGRGTVLVVTAGTADLPVAEEAAISAEVMGNAVERLYDVGVAGMEGALPSVVGGLVDRPVIALPTSVGYGTSFGGLAALLGMLNTCAAGVVVVNIDNGFGAAAAATRINQRRG